MLGVRILNTIYVWLCGLGDRQQDNYCVLSACVTFLYSMFNKICHIFGLLCGLPSIPCPILEPGCECDTHTHTHTHTLSRNWVDSVKEVNPVQKVSGLIVKNTVSCVIGVSLRNTHVFCLGLSDKENCPSPSMAHSAAGLQTPSEDECPICRSTPTDPHHPAACSHVWVTSFYCHILWCYTAVWSLICNLICSQVFLFKFSERKVD